MPADPTEARRREMIESGETHVDLAVAKITGDKTWTTDQMREEFEAIGFLAPFVMVRRRSDGVKGTLEFTHSPRVYFNFVPEGGAS